MSLKLDSPYCRVWAAGPELLAKLPPEELAPVHDRKESDRDIDIDFSHGLDWTTCVSCDWHVDWDQMFELVLARGTGTLHIGGLSPKKGAVSDSVLGINGRPKKCRLVRGDVIQLWPLAWHRVSSRGTLAFIEAKGGNELSFRTQEDQEQLLVNCINDRFRKAELRKMYV